MKPSDVMVSRRGLLAAGALATAAACTAGDGAAAPSPTQADPDVALRLAAQERERALISAYRREAQQLPHLAAELDAIAEHHVQHLTALGGRGASPTPTGAAVPQRADTSPAAVAARRRLAALERSAAVQHERDAAAASLRLAPLLASLCASEASHAAVL